MQSNESSDVMELETMSDAKVHRRRKRRQHTNKKGLFAKSNSLHVVAIVFVTLACAAFVALSVVLNK